MSKRDNESGFDTDEFDFTEALELERESKTPQEATPANSSGWNWKRWNWKRWKLRKHSPGKRKRSQLKTTPSCSKSKPGWERVYQSLHFVKLAGTLCRFALFGVVAVVVGLGIDEILHIVQAKTAGSNLAGKAVIGFVAMISLLMFTAMAWLTLQSGDRNSGPIFLWIGFTALSTYWIWSPRPTAVTSLLAIMAVLLTGCQVLELIGWLRCLALPRGASGKPLLWAASASLCLTAVFSFGVLYLGGTHFKQLNRPQEIGHFVASIAAAYGCGCVAQLIGALFVRSLVISLDVEHFHQRMTRYAVLHTAISLGGFLVGYLMLKDTLAGWPAGIATLCVLMTAACSTAHFLDSLDRCLKAREFRSY